MNLKESVFWYMHASERSLEIMRDLTDDKYRAAAGRIEAKVEMLQAILDENNLTDEYHQWLLERSGK